MTVGRRGELENEIYVVGYVDDEGNLLEDVADRFNTRYAFHNTTTGETMINTRVVGERGINGSSLRDVIAFGFSTAEYKAMLAYEEEYGVPIRSEEELDELFPYEQKRAPR